jgi:cbb3-type cytochrome oxidase subunit 1
MTQNYLTAKGFCLTSAFWFVVATSMGLLGATELMAPDLTENIGWLVFGRVRPIHVNLVLFGFVTPGLLAAAFYYLPRLLRTELYSEKLGFLTVLAWNVTLVFAVVSLALGYSQGREYAEMIWPVDILVVLAFALVFVNFIMTVARRKEPILYVSVWYACAAVVLTAVTFALGNVIWRPNSGSLVGIPDAILLWFYGHNVFGLLLTPLSAGVAYTQGMPGAALQPHPLFVRLLVAAGGLHPYRDSPPASGAGSHLAESYFHSGQCGHGHTGHGIFD